MANTYDLGAVTSYAIAVEHGYTGTEAQFAEELTGATAAARAAAEDASDAEAYAVGKRGGVDVGSTDPAYHNNAKYWAQNASGENLAQAFSTSTAYAVGDYVLYSNKLYRFTTAHSAGAWNSAQVSEVKTMDEVSSIKGDLSELESLFVGDVTINGNMVHINDAVIDTLIKKNVINISPQQSGSGVPSSSNVRNITGRTNTTIKYVGKNILDWFSDGKVPSTNGGQLVTAAGVRSDYIPANPNTSYTISGYLKNGNNPQVYLFYYDKNKTFLSFNMYNGGDYTTERVFVSLSVITPANTAYIMVRVGGSNDTTRYENLQLEINNSATEYELRSETSYAITWETVAGTVYGGILDTTTGKLVITHGFISSYAGETINTPWMSNKDIYVEGAVPTTGAQVVYPLDEQDWITHTINPIEITLMRSVNNFFVDAGSLKITYSAKGNVPISANLKEAIALCFAHVAWSDNNGASYYNTLQNAL